MIVLDSITHHFGVRPVLRRISMTVNAGELVVVMGPNGSGKSTLLKVIAGVIWPLKGQVTIDGHVRRGTVDEENQLRRRVVYLPDQLWLPQGVTAREYLGAVASLYGIDPDRALEHAQRLILLFDMQGYADSAMQSCSAGQQKKIALASALISEAPIMVLDEPFSGGLDPAGIMALERTLQRLAERQDVTVVMTTPVPEIVDQLAAGEAPPLRIAILREGEIVAFDSPAGLRRGTGCEGPLQEVLQRLMHPRTLAHIEQYFEEASP
jgi:ABC-2 type transport system ATP-binding protein